MVCVRLFANTEDARAYHQLLQRAGINARMVVDPLESRFPALGDFSNVALMVEDSDRERAEKLLGGNLRQAG